MNQLFGLQHRGDRYCFKNLVFKTVSVPLIFLFFALQRSIWCFLSLRFMLK
jgi:hypothetical protein